MKNTIIALVMMLGVQLTLAETLLDNNSMIQELHRIEKIQSKILLNNKNSTYDKTIFSKYKDSKYIKVLESWFDLIDERDENLLYFLSDSTNWVKYIVLEHLRFVVSLEDFNMLEHRVNSVLELSTSTKKDDFNKKGIVNTAKLHLREVPILAQETERNYVVKDDVLTILYVLKHKKGLWGYVVTQNKDKGWVNLRYVKPVRDSL